MYNDLIFVHQPFGLITVSLLMSVNLAVNISLANMS